MVGQGWALTGLSTIHRCAKTIVQDGTPGRISFDTADRLCLDGQRMVRVNVSGASGDVDTAYWEPGAEFRTEQDSFARITRQSNGSYKVETKEGRINYYGSSFDGTDMNSTIQSAGRTDNQPLAWAIGWSEDRVGNYIAFSYNQDTQTGEYTPATVRYGGNWLANQAPDLSVRFDYEVRADSNVMYIGGARNDLVHRLTHVRTYINASADGSGGALVRDHEIHYVQSASSGRSLVDWMQACATNPVSGILGCLPKTTFEWGAGGTIALKPMALSPILLPVLDPSVTFGAPGFERDARYQGNIDGSGQTTFIVNRFLTCDKGPCVDSDKPIIPNKLRIKLPSGLEFDHTLDIASAGFAPKASLELRLADLNTDGRDDLILVDRDTKKWGYCLNESLADGTYNFRCAPGNGSAFQGTVDLRSESKMHVIAMDRATFQLSDCEYVSGSMQCAILPISAVASAVAPMPMPSGNDGFGISGIELAKQGFSDFISTWASSIPAADLSHGYNKCDTSGSCELVDVSVGTGMCFYRQNKLQCQSVYNHIIPGDQAFQTQCVPGDSAPSCQTVTRIPSVLSGQNIGDLNGDGLTDFIFLEQTTDTPYANYGYPLLVTSVTLGSPHVCFSKELGADCRFDATLASALVPPVDPHTTNVTGQIADFVGDGVQRLLSYTDNATSGKLKLCRYSGTAFVCQDFDASIPIEVPQSVFLDDSGVPAFLTNCDNMQSTVDRKPCTAVTLSAPANADKMLAVVNGVGLRDEVDYARGEDSAVYKRISSIDGVDRLPIYPQRAVTPGVLVKQLRRATGNGNWLTSSYSYEGAMSDAAGRGSLGFARVQVADDPSGIHTSSVLSQNFPTVGMVLRQQKTSSAGVLLADTVNVLSVRSLTAPSGAVTVFPFVDTSTLTRKDLTGADLGTTIIHSEYEGTTYGDFLGNRARQTENVTGAGISFSTETTTSYYNDRSAWLIGMPSSVSVTKTASDGSAVTRSFTNDYNTVNGLLTATTIEKGSPLYEVVTSYDRSRNSFGLVNTVTQKWTSPLNANLQRQLSDTDYDAKGRFAITVKNALSHLQTLTFYPGSGAPMGVIDANGLQTSWDVDGFGRVTLERRPDQNATRRYRKQCSGCANGAVVAEVSDVVHGTDRVSVPTVVYSDAAGHNVLLTTWGFDGRRINTAMRYDTAGRLYETEQPHFEGDAANLASRQYYDDLNRVYRTEAVAEGNAAVAAINQYDGYVTTRTNFKLQKRVETRDAIGQLRKVEQIVSAAGHTNAVTQFDYDPFGNLSRTTDPNGNVIIIGYDRLGRKSDLTDPDLGNIHYDVDPLGQVWKQTSPEQRAKGLSTTMNYDALGRLTARFEPDLESHWTFDQAVGMAASACAAAKSCGQLIEAYTQAGTVKDFSRVYSYDALARPASIAQTINDGTANSVFKDATVWDTWGRVINKAFQRNSDPIKSYDSRYNDKGYLARLEREGQVLWSVTVQDAAERPSQIALGNGLTQNRVTNPYTGRLDSASLGTPSLTRLQESYLYDVLGNVSTRSQFWDVSGFTETFGYDDLNRLTSSHVAGAPEQLFDFDNAGNILSKGDVGTGQYVYLPQGGQAKTPHAVQSIPGVGSFSYDLNGNMLSGGGRVYTWNSFDMPVRITLGAAVWSEFVYGPDHERTRQRRSDGSVEVYAGAQVVESNGTTTTVKTYWPYGVGVDIEQIGGAATSNWIHTDRLGSIVALTDDKGQIKEKLSYDAWGKRRTLNGQLVGGSATSDDIDGIVDNRGFTGHEMLDQLNLVHMNGRVYDPFTARFVSGDPLIQDPLNGQNYNRYSYVFNNPTNLTDPTGFHSECNSGANWCVSFYPNGAPDREADSSEKNKAAKPGSAADRKGTTNQKSDSRAENSANKPGFIDNFKNGFVQGVSDASQSRGYPDVTDGAADKSSKGYLLGIGVGTGFVAQAQFGGKMPAGAGAERLPQDINVNPRAPAALPTSRPIGTSPTQNAAAQRKIAEMKAAGYTDIRVNQQQTNALGSRVGVNRPDVSGTSPAGVREHHEYDRSSSGRGPSHEARIKANDPHSTVELHTVN